MATVASFFFWQPGEAHNRIASSVVKVRDMKRPFDRSGRLNTSGRSVPRDSAATLRSSDDKASPQIPILPPDCELNGHIQSDLRLTSLKKCATGAASTESPANADFKRHRQSRCHTFSTGCKVEISWMRSPLRDHRRTSPSPEPVLQTKVCGGFVPDQTALFRMFGVATKFLIRKLARRLFR